MRKLMWFTIGFAAACTAGVYLLTGAWLLLMGLFCLIGFTAMLFLKSKPAKISAVVLLGCVAGFFWCWGHDSLYLSTARSYDGETVPMEITASDYSYATAYGSAFDGKTVLNGKTYRLRCYLNEETAVIPGYEISGSFRL